MRIYKAYAIKIVGTVLVSNCIALAFYWVRRKFPAPRQIADDGRSQHGVTTAF